MVLNLIGGLLSRRSARRQQQRERLQALEDYARQRADNLADYDRVRADNLADQARQREWALGDQAAQFQRLRDAAEAGGFNPLTALGLNPGGGSVGNPGVNGGSITSASINPVASLASNDFIGEALARDVQTGFNIRQERRDIERDAIEKALMREELRMMRRQGEAVQRSMSFGYEIPQANNYTGVTSANAAPALAAHDAPRPNDGPIGGAPALTAFGRNWYGSGAFSKGQVIEDNLGEGPISWPMHIGIATDMIGYTIGRDMGVVKAPFGQKPGRVIPDTQLRKPFPRQGSEGFFNNHLGRHRPLPHYLRD